MNDTTYTLHEFLADQMHRQGLSLSEFARKLGIGKTTLHRLLDKDNPTVPTLETVVKLSEFTGASIDTIARMAYPDVAQRLHISPTAQMVAEQFERLPKHIQDMILTVIRGRFDPE